MYAGGPTEEEITVLLSMAAILNNHAGNDTAIKDIIDDYFNNCAVDVDRTGYNSELVFKIGKQNVNLSKCRDDDLLMEMYNWMIADPDEWAEHVYSFNDDVDDKKDVLKLIKSAKKIGKVLDNINAGSTYSNAKLKQTLGL